MLVFTEKEVLAIAGAKKIDILRQIEGAVQAAGLTFRPLPKAKGEDGAAQIETALEALRAIGEDAPVGRLADVRWGRPTKRDGVERRSGLVLEVEGRRLYALVSGKKGRRTILHGRQRSPGRLPSRSLSVSPVLLSCPRPTVAPLPLSSFQRAQDQTGGFAGLWNKMLGESGLPLVDASEGVGRALAVKDASEITNVKKAAFLATGVMNGMAVPQIEGAKAEGRGTGVAPSLPPLWQCTRVEWAIPCEPLPSASFSGVVPAPCEPRSHGERIDAANVTAITCLPRTHNSALCGSINLRFTSSSSMPSPPLPLLISIRNH